MFRLNSRFGLLSIIAVFALIGLSVGCADQVGPDQSVGYVPQAMLGDEMEIPTERPLPFSQQEEEIPFGEEGHVFNDPIFVGMESNPQTRMLNVPMFVNKTISAQFGGSISNGAITLDFPPGALSADTEISMSMDPSGLLICDMGPDGAQFNVPVLITLDLTGTTSEGQSFNTFVAWNDESTGKWVMIENLPPPDPNHIQALVNHFSRYSGIGG